MTSWSWRTTQSPRGLRLWSRLLQRLHESLMKTGGGDGLTDAPRKPSDSVSASGSGEERSKDRRKVTEGEATKQARGRVADDDFCLADWGRRWRRKARTYAALTFWWKSGGGWGNGGEQQRPWLLFHPASRCRCVFKSLSASPQWAQIKARTHLWVDTSILSLSLSLWLSHFLLDVFLERGWCETSLKRSPVFKISAPWHCKD